MRESVSGGRGRGVRGISGVVVGGRGPERGAKQSKKGEMARQADVNRM